MIPPQLIVAGVIAVTSATTGFGVAWKIQNGIQAQQELQHAEQQLENQRLVAKTRSRQDQAVIAAQNEGQARAARLRLDADAASSALVGLHDAAAAALRDAATSSAACTERAAALSELLIASAASCGDLAQKADRHASDVRTLIDAWPK